MNTVNKTTTDEAQIRALMEKHVKSIQLKDIEGSVSSYADDVLFFDVVGPLQHTGSNALKTRLEEWLSTLQDPVGYEIQELKIVSSNNVSFSISLNHVNAMTQGGEKPDMWWRETLCWQKINGNWLIKHAHSSVPFDVISGKASIDLKPEIQS